MLREDLKIITKEEMEDIELQIVEKQLEIDLTIEIKNTARNDETRSLKVTAGDNEQLVLIKRIIDTIPGLTTWVPSDDTDTSDKIVIFLPLTYERLLNKGTLKKLILLTTNKLRDQDITVYQVHLQRG